jgi:methylphosphotriester-DNA--protein-cysteine methyltransferase
MFNSLSDTEYRKNVDDILCEYCNKQHNIQEILENRFGRSFSSINKRYKRITRKTIFETYNNLFADKAISLLKEKPCFEVMLDLGFKYESNFARWLRNIKGVNPSEVSQ